MLGGHKTADEDPALCTPRYRRPLVCVQHPILFMLLSVRLFLHQQLQYARLCRKRGAMERAAEAGQVRRLDVFPADLKKYKEPPLETH